MESTQEMRDRRMKLVQAARTIVESAKGANRQLTPDETKRYEDAMAEVDRLKDTIDLLEARAAGPAPANIREQPGDGLIYTDRRVDAEVPIIGRERRFVDLARARGAQYSAESLREPLRLGKIVRALGTGRRDGMSDLELRVMSSGVDANGGFTVPEILASNFIDRARNQAVVAKAGAQFVPMSTDTVNIARLASGPSNLAWHGENAAITASDLTLERVTFTARTLPCLIKCSVELAEDSANIDAIIERELTAALALELDRAALRGNGAIEPMGILNQPNVTIQTNGVNGTAFAYSQLVNAASAVSASNFTPTGRIYHSRVQKSAALLADSTGQPLRAPAYVDAIPEFVTNAIPINLTVGGSSDCSELYVGQWDQVMIGVRTTFRIEVTRVGSDSSSSAFTNMQVWTRAYLRADVQLAHGAAFAVSTAIRP